MSSFHRVFRPASAARIAACALVGVHLWTAPLAGQEAALRGVVLDPGGQPVAGAEVSAGAALARTGDDGAFELTLPGGRHALRVDRLGYRSVTLRASAPGPVRIVLSPAPILMEGLTAIGSPGELDEVRARMLEVPGAVDLVEDDELERTRQTNFADVLRFTPGVYAQSRFGAADELQLSIRGSGLRNNFHLRGVNVLVNGMPYRNADGFTDFESLEILTAANVQVYKGGNALRYGGGTLGGAINLETRTGYTAEPFGLYAQGGSNGFFKGQISSGGVFDDLDYYASYARTDLDGFRRHSGQQRDRLNGHLGVVLGSRVDLRGFWFFADVEEDLPGSLTREEMESDPEGAAPANVANDWGREYTLHHLGLQMRAQLTPHQRLEVSPYFQFRDIVHPIFRVIDQISRDVGLEVRYENSAPIGGRENRFVMGFQPTFGNVDNRHYENVGGEKGALAKDQRDEAGGAAVYLEDVFSITPRLSAIAGARYDRSRRAVEDAFLADGDQTDERIYEALLPRVGMIVELPEIGGQIFANASGIQEPPLLLELNSLTVPGLVDLVAQKAWQFELGTRGRAGDWRWELSAYDIELEDEIVNVNIQPFPGAPFTVPSYRNVDETRHLGLEAGLELSAPVELLAGDESGERAGFRMAYTLSKFEYVSDPDHRGNEIPGIPTHVLQLEAEYAHPAGLTLSPSIEWVPDGLFVDSANTITSDGWLTLGMRAEWQIEGLGGTVFVEGRNLTDEVYSPTVSVDDAAGRYFQPADGRSLYAGVRWQP
ncbi:MAG TPA: TonB-dependent receptor [Gemmatimonadota bacterium]|nr:TonB-dependent receptor [Gemmatimonadota bacterium]